MKIERNLKVLPWLVLAAGALGFALYLWLMGTENDKGFINKFHISAILLLILTGIVVVGLLYVAYRLTQVKQSDVHFPASYWSALGAWLAAVGVGVTSVLEVFQATDFLQLMACLCGVAAALALLFVGNCRRVGKKSNVLAYAVICGYFMLHLICMYRHWGARPQLYDYCFQLLAVVCAMLATYHRANFDVDCGKRGPYIYFSLLTLFFCVICLGDGPLYKGIGLWTLMELYSVALVFVNVQEATDEAG